MSRALEEADLVHLTINQTINSARPSTSTSNRVGCPQRHIGGPSTSGLAYCERHKGADALATIGVQYKGQFQISTRVRVTAAIDGCAAGVVFWYKGTAGLLPA